MKKRPSSDYFKRQMAAKLIPKTYWNGEETPAVRVKIIIRSPTEHDPKGTWWLKHAGEDREAVRVTYHGEVFYLDNATGLGWSKVTKGRGSPQWGHASLPNGSTEITW